MTARSLQFRHLSETELVEVYQSEMKQDFQPNELKPLSMIQNALSCGEYAAYGILAEDSKRIGYAMILKLPDVRLLDYFAISKQYRENGYGTAALQVLSEMSGTETLLIETENPDYMKDLTAHRRLQFYQRCGCRDTGVRAEIWGVPYQILMLTGEIEDAASGYERLYRHFLPPHLFAEKVRISLKAGTMETLAHA